MTDKIKPCGDCYLAAYNHTALLADDTKHATVCLVHGSIVPRKGPWTGKRITHAWVDSVDKVHEFSNGNRLVLDKKDFADTFIAEVYVKYSPDEAIIQNLKHNNYGPWDTKSLKMGEIE